MDCSLSLTHNFCSQTHTHITYPFKVPGEDPHLTAQFASALVSATQEIQGTRQAMPTVECAKRQALVSVCVGGNSLAIVTSVRPSVHLHSLQSPGHLLPAMTIESNRIESNRTKALVLTSATSRLAARSNISGTLHPRT